MTAPALLALLRELHALERFEAAILVRDDLAATFDWQCCLVAIRDRLTLCRYVRSQEPRPLVEAAELFLRGEREPQAFSQLNTLEPLTGEPLPGRIH